MKYVNNFSFQANHILKLEHSISQSNKLEAKNKNQGSLQNVMKYSSKRQNTNIGTSKDNNKGAITAREKSTKQYNSLKRKINDDENTEPFIQ